MSLPVIDYIGWIEGRPGAVAHDLGSSDLRGPGDADPAEVVPERLAGLATPGTGADIAGLVAEAYGVEPASVLPLPGATLANAVAAATALDRSEPASDRDADAEPASDRDGDAAHPEFPDGFDPGGSVLVEKPAYEPLVDTPQLFGARIDRFRRPATEDWRLNPDRVAAAAVEDTALVTVTNRHNPTGRLSTRETLRAAAEAASAVDARLLVDEVYAPYVLDSATGATDDGGAGGLAGSDGDARRAFGGVTGAGLDEVVVTGSLTKFHGLGGLRVGWLVADPDFVEHAERAARHFPALAGPSRALGRRALVHRDALERESRELLARNAALLSAFVADRTDLSGPVYEGSSYALLEHESADGDAVAEAALDRDLLVVPGRFFESPERFRVSLGRDTEHVREALNVLGGVLDDL